MADIGNFANRMQNLNKLLNSSKRMDVENRNNIAWYCKDQKRQYVERCSSKRCVKIKQ